MSVDVVARGLARRGLGNVTQDAIDARVLAVAAAAAAAASSVSANSSAIAAALQTTPAGIMRPRNDGSLGTLSSSATRTAGMNNYFAYSSAPSLFTFYGGAIGVYGTYFLKLPSSIKPSGGNTSTTLSQICARMAVMTDAPAIEFSMSGSSTKWRAYLDGKPIADAQSYATTTGAAYNKATLPSAKPGGQRVDIEWEQNGGITFDLTVAVAPGYSVWAVDTSNRVRIAIMGDSYGESTGATYSGYGLAYEFGRALGGADVEIISASNGGSGYTVAGSGYTATNSTRLDHLASLAPDVVVIPLGINDTSTAAATVTAAVLSALQGIRSRLPNVGIEVWGCWAGSTGPSAAVVTTENAILAGVNQFADPLCIFVPVSTAVPPWINGTGRSGAKNGTGNSDWAIGGTTGADGTHPTDDGHRYIGAVKAAEAARPLLRLFRRV